MKNNNSDVIEFKVCLLFLFFSVMNLKAKEEISRFMAKLVKD